MSANFRTTELADNTVLVEGTDVRGTEGQQVINPYAWVELKLRNEEKEAVASVDDAIKSLVAPITAAIEAANRRLTRPELDPLSYVTLSEGTEAVAGAPRELVKLDSDSVILRALEEGQGDRLIWVSGKLTLTKPSTSAPAPVEVPDVESEGTNAAE